MKSMFLTWLEEMNPQHLSWQIYAQGEDAWQTLSTRSISNAWHTLGLQYVEQMHGSWLGWWLRLQCAISVLWVSEVSESTSSLCSGFLNVLVMLHLCLVHLLKTTHYSKYHRFHVCMLFLAKSSYKEVGNLTVLSPVCLWFTKTKQNHII